MQLILYPTTDTPPKVIPAPSSRTWMDGTRNGHAYRCLPLNIANAHGWQILNPAPFVAEWNGKDSLDGISIQRVGLFEQLKVSSHFGYGVLTFVVSALFRTEPGWDLLVSGPTNEQKDAIQPLTGIVETDWAPFTFTMNWRFTRPHTPIAFEKDEPFCMIYPIKRGAIETFQPVIRPLSADPEVESAYNEFAQSRREFLHGLKISGSRAQEEGWQKHYFQGKSSSSYGRPGKDHRTKLKLKPFKPA